MKALVVAFNQEKALIGAFSVIMRTGCGTDGSFDSTKTYVKPNEMFILLAFRKPTLKELKVGGTFGHKITDRGVSSLCAEGGSKIESLVMERCAVTDPSLHTLATEMRISAV